MIVLEILIDFPVSVGGVKVLSLCWRQDGKYYEVVCIRGILLRGGILL